MDLFLIPSSYLLHLLLPAHLIYMHLHLSDVLVKLAESDLLLKPAKFEPSVFLPNHVNLQDKASG